MTLITWRRDGRIVLRVRQIEKTVIADAAAIAQENVSEFMRVAAIQRAMVILERSDTNERGKDEYRADARAAAIAMVGARGLDE